MERIWKYTTQQLWQLLLKTQTVLEVFANADEKYNYSIVERQLIELWGFTDDEISEIWDLLYFINNDLE